MATTDGGDALAAAEKRRFSCNICLEVAKSPVLSMCGHLFCWPCLQPWLKAKPRSQVCPVCESAISRDKVTPVFERDGDNIDPRDQHLPPPAKKTKTQQYEGNTRSTANASSFTSSSSSSTGYSQIGNLIACMNGSITFVTAAAVNHRRTTASAVNDDTTVDADETAAAASSSSAVSDRMTRSRTARRDRANRSKSPLDRPKKKK